MVLIRATVMAIALLIFCALATETFAAKYECCRSYTAKKIPFAAIRGYSVQTINGVCDINAIIFHYTFNKKKGRVCTNPALDWVMDYVNRLRTRAQRVHIQTAQAQH